MGYAAQNPEKDIHEPDKFQEYLALETQNPDERYIYWDGEIFAMAGALKKHNLLAFSIALILKRQTKGNKCQTYMENVRTQIEEGGKYVYPDIVMTCDERDDEDALLVKYPSVIIEILSKGTELIDSSIKLVAYLKMPTMKHYLMVSQTFVVVIHYYKNEQGEIITKFYTDLTDIIVLQGFAIELPLSQIYEDILL